MKDSKYASMEIRALSHMLKRFLENNETQKMVNDMTGTHGWILGYLFKNEGSDIFQRDLEKEFSIRRSTVTCMLQLMEKNGFILRVPVERDARLKKIVLTEKAYEVKRILNKNHAMIEECLTRDISDEDMKIFFAVADKMQQNLQNEGTKGDSYDQKAR